MQFGGLVPILPYMDTIDKRLYRLGFKTQIQIAQALGVSPGYICSILAGRRQASKGLLLLVKALEKIAALESQIEHLQEVYSDGIAAAEAQNQPDQTAF